MSEKSKNPFFVLGVDYGSSTGAATAAFGRASRRVRRGGDDTFTIEDLTTALSEIEEAHRNHEADKLGEHFRVPADPQVYEVTTENGLLLLPVTPQPRKTSPITAEVIEQMKCKVLAEGLTSLFASLDQHKTIYDLGITLGGDLSLSQAAPSMASQIKEMTQQSLHELTERIPACTDPEQLAEWARAISPPGGPLPAEPAVALVLNPKTPESSTRSLLESPHFPESAAQELAARPENDPLILDILAKSESINVRRAVAANPTTPPSLLEQLRKDNNGRVREAAQRRKRGVTWVKIGAAVLIALLALLAVALATGFVKFESSRTGVQSETNTGTTPATPAPDFPEITASQWNRIVRYPNNFINYRLAFYAQVVAMGRKPPSGRTTFVADALYRQPARYSEKIYTGVQSWVSISKADDQIVSPGAEVRIEGTVVGETRFKENGEVSRIPWFRAESISYAP